MYSVVLVLHSLWRWVVVLLGIWTVVRMASRMNASVADVKTKKVASWFVAAIDIQLLLGLLLFLGLSPTTKRLLVEGQIALRDPHVLYWTMEHAIPMIIAVFIAHGGQVLLKRASTPARYKLALIVLGIALLVILVSIPWPFRIQGRPWIRL